MLTLDEPKLFFFFAIVVKGMLLLLFFLFSFSLLYEKPMPEK
jgi:hypothetical protein